MAEAFPAEGLLQKTPLRVHIIQRPRYSVHLKFIPTEHCMAAISYQPKQQTRFR